MEALLFISAGVVALTGLGAVGGWAIRSRFGRRRPKSTYGADHQSEYEAAVRDVFRR